LGVLFPDELIWRRIGALMQVSGRRYFDDVDRPGGSGGALMAVIVIAPRTSDPTTVVMHGELAAVPPHGGRAALKGRAHPRRLAMSVDRRRCAGSAVRCSTATTSAGDAWQYRPPIHDEAPVAHSGQS